MTEHTISDLADALVDAAAEDDKPLSAVLPDGLTAEQLRELVLDIAARVHALGAPNTETLDPSSRGVCRAAAALAAEAFGTTPEQIHSPARLQAVSDARAVAMAAARRHGLTLTGLPEMVSTRRPENSS